MRRHALRLFRKATTSLLLLPFFSRLLLLALVHIKPQTRVTISTCLSDSQVAYITSTSSSFVKGITERSPSECAKQISRRSVRAPKRFREQTAKPSSDWLYPRHERFLIFHKQSLKPILPSIFNTCVRVRTAVCPAMNVAKKRPMLLSNWRELLIKAAEKLTYMGPGTTLARDCPNPKIEAPTKILHSKGSFGLSGYASSSPKNERFIRKPSSWYFSSNTSRSFFQPLCMQKSVCAKPTLTKRKTSKLGSNVFLFTEEKRGYFRRIDSSSPTQSASPNKRSRNRFREGFRTRAKAFIFPYTPTSVTMA